MQLQNREPAWRCRGLHPNRDLLGAWNCEGSGPLSRIVAGWAIVIHQARFCRRPWDLTGAGNFIVGRAVAFGCGTLRQTSPGTTKTNQATRGPMIAIRAL